METEHIPNKHHQERYKSIDSGRSLVDSTIQRTYVKIDTNAKSLIATKKWNVMRKIFVTN